ncbi:MAG: tRNA (N(6)-L-threonylcarbamoyladenosine(37)-C(2))-methylthiotransferase MtaB [Bacteroidales bacterium]
MSKVAFFTLGCKLNFSESSTYARDFIKNGFDLVPHSSKADVYVINTCTVTEHADKKCRNVIRKCHRLNPDAAILVTGCYAQLKPDEIASIEGVDVILSAQNKGDVYSEFLKILDRKKNNDTKDLIAPKIFKCDINNIDSIYPAYSTVGRTRSFLKVQDGCDYGCTYCTIPNARGKSRSMSIDSIIKETYAIAQQGIKEVVLTGVNIGDFGKTIGESFLDLLKALNEIEAIDRYRISSIEPNLLKPDIIDWISSGTKFQPHFHIPLQSGCDQVLARMKRRYNTSMFREKMDYIRLRMGDVFFGIDVIVGFPGETDEEFMTTYNFLKEVNPAFIHIFPYSRRENTLAYDMPNQVDDRVKSNRAAKLKELCDTLHDNYCKSYDGKELQVLFESTDKHGKMYGYSENYIRVEHDYDKSLVNQIRQIKYHF